MRRAPQIGKLIAISLVRSTSANICIVTGVFMVARNKHNQGGLRGSEVYMSKIGHEIRTFDQIELCFASSAPGKIITMLKMWKLVRWTNKSTQHCKRSEENWIDRKYLQKKKNPRVQIQLLNASAMLKVLRMGWVGVFYLFMYLSIIGRMKKIVRAVRGENSGNAGW